MARTFDEIRELREEWEATLDHSTYRQRVADQIAAMAPGEPGRAELLACASSDLSTGDATTDDLSNAEELARAAIDDGGETTIDARIALVIALFKQGRTDDGRAMVRDCLRDRSAGNSTIGLHATLGETLEELNEPNAAQRAYTVGLRKFEPDLDDPDFDETMCLAGRYRVRRLLGLGTDSLDQSLEEFAPDAAEEIRDRARLRSASGRRSLTDPQPPSGAP